MSGLRSAIDDFTVVPYGDMSVEELAETLAEAADGIRRLEAFMAQGVRDIIELDALRDEMDSIMFQILESKSIRSPAEAALHAYLSKKAQR